MQLSYIETGIDIDVALHVAPTLLWMTDVWLVIKAHVFARATRLQSTLKTTVIQ